MAPVPKGTNELQPQEVCNHQDNARDLIRYTRLKG